MAVKTKRYARHTWTGIDRSSRVRRLARDPEGLRRLLREIERQAVQLSGGGAICDTALEMLYELSDIGWALADGELQPVD